MNQTILGAAEGQGGGIYERSNLTRLQLLYWMGQKLRPETPLFNTILTFTISGKVVGERFKEAFQALLDHSDALRTVIEETDGVPQRRTDTDFSHALEHLDFSLDPKPEEAYQTWLRERCRIPMNLESRLFDSALIKISDGQFVWYLNQHHIITDASSFFLIFQRMAIFYERSLRGEALTMPGLPTFENYVKYEQSYRSSPQSQRVEAYWQRKLAPGPEPISFYGQVPLKKTTRVWRVSYDLGFERSQRLRVLAKQKEIFTVSEDLSLYNIFAALLFIQLHRMSGNHRLGFVAPVHNRFTEVTRDTVGLLMELCPFQVEVSQDDTIMSVIKKVKRETRETLAYYQNGSGLSLRNESFDVMFNTHHMPVLHLNGAPVQVERIHPGHGSESLALHVNDFESSGNFVLYFDLHCDVFTDEQREQTVRAFVQLVDAFLENAAHPLSELHLRWAEKEDQSSTKNELSRDLEDSRWDRGRPQDMLELKLIQIWEEILGVKPIGTHDNFFDLGGNSWLAVRLFVQVEELTGQYLPLTTLLNAATVSDLATCVRQEMGRKLWSTLITIQPGGARKPLYMVPGAGGNGLAVSRIARHLGEDQPVLMFQIPLGEGEERPPLARIEDMAAHYVEALRVVQPEGPYLLGGYSAGGLVAFEVAQQLQRQGQRVDLLAIIDVPAQGASFRYVRQLTRGFSAFLGIESDKELETYLFFRDTLFRLNYFLRLGYRESLGRYVARFRGFGGRLKRFWQLDHREKLVRLQARFRPANAGTPKPAPVPDKPPNVEAGDLAWRSEDRYMRKYFEINNTAVKCYVPQAYSGRITLFRSREGYRYPEQRSPDPQLGWGRIATDGVELYVIPGNHIQIVREPNVKILGKQLRTCLDRVHVDDHRTTYQTE